MRNLPTMHELTNAELYDLYEFFLWCFLSLWVSSLALWYAWDERNWRNRQ